MTTAMYVIISMTLYKVASLVVGLSSLYMGYKLFAAGVWGHAGEIDGTFQNNKVVIKRAAPGTFFALFGTIIICVTIFKGMEYRSGQDLIDMHVDPQPIVNLPKEPPVKGELK